MPLNSNMALLQELTYNFVLMGLNDAAATFLDPVALGAGVTLPIYCF